MLHSWCLLSTDGLAPHWTLYYLSGLFLLGLTLLILLVIFLEDRADPIVKFLLNLLGEGDLLLKVLFTSSFEAATCLIASADLISKSSSAKTTASAAPTEIIFMSELSRLGGILSRGSNDWSSVLYAWS